MAELAYHLSMPECWSQAAIFASPHSGRYYPPDLLRRSVLDPVAMRSSEDAFVDLLFDTVPGLGAPLLSARMARAYVDLNRGPEELDPSVVAGIRTLGHNPRVASGLGVVPRVVSGGRAIYRGKISADEARLRVADWWRPYHDRLQSLLDEALARFGSVILFDLHSMPHEAVASRRAGGGPPEVVLGDRFGAAADLAIVERVEAIFAEAGLRVARNAPFSGAYVTQHYGRPGRGQHVVQIEIDRALYMDEATIQPSADYPAFKALMTDVAARLAALATPCAGGRLAAE